MNTICIVEQPLEVKEWQGQRVITFKDIDKVHQRPDGTASRNFKSNRKHFIANVDYFQITRKEFGTKFVPNSKLEGNPNLTVILLTESGYLMLAKSLTDDLAWDVQRALVNNYFRGRQPVQQQLPMDAPMPVQPQRPRMPYRKTWKGYPVMTTEDLMMLLHCDQQDIYRLKNSLGHCGKRLDKQDYVTFKRLHGIQSHASQMMIFERSDVVRMLEKRQVYNQYKDFIEQYFEPIHNERLSDEEMKKALKQAEYLCVAASIYDDVQIKSMIKKTLTTLMIKIGVWTENHAGFDGVTDAFNDGTVEGKNKVKSLALADVYWNGY